MKISPRSIRLLIVILVAGCATPESTKTSLELQAFQKKEFETTKKIAFASTLSVFQDLGYIVRAADIDTGLITAASPTKTTKFFQSKMQNTEATAFVEEFTPTRTAVRLNFVRMKETSSSYGMKAKKDLPIEDAGTYQVAFQKIQEAIFIRKSVQ